MSLLEVVFPFSSRFYSTSSKYDWVCLEELLLLTLARWQQKQNFYRKGWWSQNFLESKFQENTAVSPVRLSNGWGFRKGGSRDSQMMFLKLSANPSLALLHQKPDDERGEKSDNSRSSNTATAAGWSSGMTGHGRRGHPRARGERRALGRGRRGCARAHGLNLIFGGKLLIKVKGLAERGSHLSNEKCQIWQC